MRGQIRYDPFKISRGPLSFLTLFLSVLSAAPNRERSRALTVATRPISIRGAGEGTEGRRRRRRRCRRAVRASTLKFRSGALWPLRGGVDTARRGREEGRGDGEGRRRWCRRFRCRGSGSGVGLHHTGPTARVSSPGKPVKTATCCVTCSLSACPRLNEYIRGEVYTPRVFVHSTIPLVPPPRPVLPHHLTSPNRAFILYTRRLARWNRDTAKKLNYVNDVMRVDRFNDCRVIGGLHFQTCWSNSALIEGDLVSPRSVLAKNMIKNLIINNIFNKKEKQINCMIWKWINIVEHYYREFTFFRYIARSGIRGCLFSTAARPWRSEEIPRL